MDNPYEANAIEIDRAGSIVEEEVQAMWRAGAGLGEIQETIKEALQAEGVPAKVTIVNTEF